MKLISKFSSLAAVLVVTTAFASADTLTLGSWGAAAGGTNTGSVANTGVVYAGPSTVSATGSAGSVPGGATATYDVSANLPWHAPGAGTYYVSFAANTGCCNNVVAPNAWYGYYSTFTLTSAASDAGYLWILADDTSSVWLNGVQLLPPSGPANGTCNDSTPNCLTPTLVALTGLVNGTNTLFFDVHQSNGSATGLDFYGAVNPIPEPSTLLMLGTGLVGSAGALLRRMRS